MFVFEFERLVTLIVYISRWNYYYMNISNIQNDSHNKHVTLSDEYVLFELGKQQFDGITGAGRSSNEHPGNWRQVVFVHHGMFRQEEEHRRNDIEECYLCEW